MPISPVGGAQPLPPQPPEAWSQYVGDAKADLLENPPNIQGALDLLKDALNSNPPPSVNAITRINKAIEILNAGGPSAVAEAFITLNEI